MVWRFKWILWSKHTSLFRDKITIWGTDYPTHYNYHIKFSSFQRSFKGFREENLKKPLYTRDNFKKYTGSKKRGDQWEQLASLFDDSLDYNWKKQSDWENSIVSSDKNQFDVSFGYEVYLEIPSKKIQELAQHQHDLTALKNLIIEIHKSFTDQLLLSR